MFTIANQINQIINNGRLFLKYNKYHCLSLGIIGVLFAISLVLRYLEYTSSASLYGLIAEPQYRYYLQSEFISTYYLSTDANNHALFMFNNWQSSSAFDHHFVITIWPNAGYPWATNIFEESLYVYTSFPSIAFALPYFIAHYLFQLTAYQPFLLFWNLFLNLVSVILIYFIVINFLDYKNHDSKNKRFILILSLLSAAIYLFTPNILHHSSMVYWAHEFLQPFYLLLLLVIAKKRDVVKPWLLFILCFIIASITWTGYTICFAVFLYYLVMYILYKIGAGKPDTEIQAKKAVKNCIAVICSVISAIVVTCIHYCSVIGMNYFPQLFDRFLARKSPDMISEALWSRIYSVFSYDFGTWAILVVILLFILMVCIYRKKGTENFKTALCRNKDKIGIIALTIIPCIETFVLLNHDIQYGFGRMKWIVPIILIIAYASYQILGKTKHKTIYISLLIAIVIHLCALNSYLYLIIFCGY